MNDTKISWTEKTWNPVSGCEKISNGCRFCYAETLATRFGADNKAFPNGFGLTLRPHKLREPYRIKEPSLIFVNSMSDLFWDQIPEDYRDRIVDVIEDTPQHQYQVLTKREKALLAYSKRRRLPPNFWAGVSVEDGSKAKRLDALREVEAEIRFVSAEPLIGPLAAELNLDGIHWVITGGESGRHLLEDERARERRALVSYDGVAWTPREDRIQWVRDIRDACLAKRVKFFHKQWGGCRPESGGRTLDGRIWDEFPRLPSKV